VIGAVIFRFNIASSKANTLRQREVSVLKSQTVCIPRAVLNTSQRIIFIMNKEVCSGWCWLSVINHRL